MHLTKNHALLQCLITTSKALYHSSLILLSNETNPLNRMYSLIFFEQHLLICENIVHAQYQLLVIINQFSWYFNKIIHNHFCPFSCCYFLQGRHIRTKDLLCYLNIFNRCWEIFLNALPYNHLQI